MDISGAGNSAARSTKLRPATLSDDFLRDVKGFTPKFGKAPPGISVQTQENTFNILTVLRLYEIIIAKRILMIMY